MTLTPEERQRIYEEEQARREAQDQIAGEKKRRGCLGCLGVIGAIIGILLLLAFLGSLMTPSSRQTTSTPSTPSEPSQPALEVVEYHSKAEEYSRYAVGTVKNNTSKQYRYVQVEVNLYDKNGNQVGSTFANVNNLEPYGTWKFKALISEDEAAKFQIKGVNGW